MVNSPRYRQIAEQFRQQIKAGNLKAGDALPTEAQIQQTQQVSRVTVRQALKLLTAEGLIESIRGSGSYVRGEKVNYDVYQLTSLDEKLNDRDLTSHSDVLGYEIIKADAEVSKMLQIDLGAHVYHIKRLRFIQSKPVTVEETWMPLSLFPDLSFEVMQGSKYHFIEHTKQLTIERSEQEILPALPSPEIAKLLKISPEQPILEKITCGYLSHNQPFEYSKNYFNGDNYRFTLVAYRHKK